MCEVGLNELFFTAPHGPENIVGKMVFQDAATQDNDGEVLSRDSGHFHAIGVAEPEATVCVCV